MGPNTYGIRVNGYRSPQPRSETALPWEVQAEPSQVIRRDPGRRRPEAYEDDLPRRVTHPRVPPPRVPPPVSRSGLTPNPADYRGDPKHYKRRRPRWGRLLVLMLVLLPLLAAAGIVGEAVWLDRSVHRATVLANYPGRPAAGKGTNWLIVGSDSREGLTPEQQNQLTTGGDVGSSRTDTLLLVHMPGMGANTPPTMVSLPRDSYVPIPGHGKDKINAAFAYGGAALLAQTVEQATGLRLDHYAEIGFGGFPALVDALGGVTVCPVEPINDPLAGINLPAGCQKLDGRNALGFVRTRATPRADLDRMINQRLFMSALLHRAASPSVWLNPWRWYSVPNAAAHALTLDRGDRVWDLARLGWALHASTTEVTVPIDEFTDADVGSVVVWNHDVASKLFAALASDGPLPNTGLDVHS